MKNFRYGFVVLHYNAMQSTIECVQSIKDTFSGEAFKIMIVDNYSPDSSGAEVQKIYENDDEVDVILCNKNLGFANGMNCGIKLLKSTYKPDFYILLNNDAVINGDNWAWVIEKKFREYSFSVMGPDVINLDGSHINPADIQMNQIEDVRKMIKVKRTQLLLCRLHIQPYARLIKRAIKRWVKKLIHYKVKVNYKFKYEATNVQLHGSCLILSRNYFNHYETLFQGTFLYFEEAILKYMCDTKGLVSLYCPEIKLLHKEAISTKTITKNVRKKEIFYLENSLNSCNSFLKWVDANEKS